MRKVIKFLLEQDVFKKMTFDELRVDITIKACAVALEVIPEKLAMELAQKQMDSKEEKK
jgi:hypothetical protein